MGRLPRTSFLQPIVADVVYRFGRLTMPHGDLEHRIAGYERHGNHMAIRACVQGFQVPGDPFEAPSEAHARTSGRLVCADAVGERPFLPLPKPEAKQQSDDVTLLLAHGLTLLVRLGTNKRVRNPSTDDRATLSRTSPGPRTAPSRGSTASAPSEQLMMMQARKKT